jgi:hypothetical protein
MTGIPETDHHSLALDSGGSTDFGSVLVRLLSNESNSPTDLSEGRVRLSKSPGCLVATGDGGWRESSTSSAWTIDDNDDVVGGGPRKLRCLPIVWLEDPPATMLF